MDAAQTKENLAKEFVGLLDWIDEHRKKIPTDQTGPKHSIEKRAQLIKVKRSSLVDI